MKRITLKLLIFILLMLCLILSCKNNGGNNENNKIIFYDPEEFTYTGEWVFRGNEYYKKYCAQYENIKKANPAEGLKKALEEKDFRFISLGGAGVFLPNINTEYNPYIDIYGSKVVWGTSDVIISSWPPLQKTAYGYAKKYNLLLIKKLKKMDKESGIK